MNLVVLKVLGIGPEDCSRYSDSMRAECSRDRISVEGKIFRTRPYRPWGPSNFLYSGCRVSFPGGKVAGS